MVTEVQGRQRAAVWEPVLWCWLCGGDRAFVSPLDDGGGEHAERLCVDCGAAVLLWVDPFPVEEAAQPPSSA